MTHQAGMIQIAPVLHADQIGYLHGIPEARSFPKKDTEWNGPSGREVLFQGIEKILRWVRVDPLRTAADALRMANLREHGGLTFIICLRHSLA